MKILETVEDMDVRVDLLKCKSLQLQGQLGFRLHLSFTVPTGRGGKVVYPHLMASGQHLFLPSL